MSRLKAVSKSAASACALALLVLALASGTALADGQGDNGVGHVVAEGLLPTDTVPPGLLDSDPGNGGVDLGNLLPPLLGEPDPGDGGKQADPPASYAPSAAPKPASKPRKRKASAPKIAGGSSNRSPVATTSRSVSSPSGPQRHVRVAPDIGLSAFNRPTEPTVSNQAEPAGPASPSIVRQVISQIPAEYQVALVGLGLLAFLFALISLRERRRSKRVERQAMVDALTALPNRQAFERRLAKEWRRSERYERSIGLLMLDLDDFKQINDGQGHAAGDRVLSEAAMVISGRIRSTDMAARWGGDEFVVLCPETNAIGLKVLARSLEDRLRHSGIASSAGFAERESGDLGPSDMLARADVSMYARKQRERKRPERRTVTLTDTRSSFASLSD